MTPRDKIPRFSLMRLQYTPLRTFTYYTHPLYNAIYQTTINSVLCSVRGTSLEYRLNTSHTRVILRISGLFTNPQCRRDVLAVKTNYCSSRESTD